MKQRWFFLNSGPCAAAFNMALDHALLEFVPQLAAPVFRFYSWTEPVASFGYFQSYAEIGRITQLRPLIRRPTGGGLVPHEADWTYSVVFPPTHEWYALRAEESYRRVHEWVRAAFARLGVVTELAPCCRKSAPGQCFMGYEKSDVLCQGRKIAGAAQRRTKTGLLIQGSVQPPPLDLAPADWQSALGAVATAQFRAQWAELILPGALLTRAEELTRTKYSLPSHNAKR